MEEFGPLDLCLAAADGDAAAAGRDRPLASDSARWMTARSSMLFCYYCFVILRSDLGLGRDRLRRIRRRPTVARRAVSQDGVRI